MVALNLVAGFESGSAGIVNDTKVTRSRWLRVEAYPRVSRGNDSVRLVLAIGLNAGTFFHEMTDPRPTSFCVHECPPSASWFRTETRLETTAGIFFRAGQGTFVFTASPYFVLRGGAPQGHLSDVPPSYHHVWGIVFVGRMAVGWHRSP
jgi:hypothetical protein